MIIDAHTHLHGSVTSSPVETTKTAFLKALDHAGIDRAIVAGLDSLNDNESILDAAIGQTERIIPFGHIDPSHAHLSSAAWRGIGEIYLPCGAAELPRQTMKTTVSIARQRGLPILMHSGEFSYTAPLLIGGLALAYPDVIWIIGHMGSLRYVLDTIEILKRLPNVYADTSGMPAPQLLQKAVREGCAKKLLFGSDYPFWNPVVERTRIEAAHLDPGIERLILGENATAMLDITHH